jgi:long-chain acyl-CoA synthetase
MTLLFDVLSAAAETRLSKTALFWGERGFTYSELLQQCNSVSHELQNKFQVKPGDRVGLWLKNRPEFIFSLFGIIQSGAVAVPINNFLKPQEVTHILDDAGINVLITDDELSVHLPALATKHPNLRSFNVEHPASSIGYPACNTASSNTLAVLIYTSGTTGRPKGAMLSHGNLIHNCESCRDVLRVDENDRMAVMLPMFHSYMLTVGVLLPLMVGGSIVLVKSLHPMRNALHEILGQRATVLPAIPAFYRSLVHAGFPPSATGTEPSPIPFRICVSGAAPLPKQVLKEFEEKFHIPLIEGYGLSEASPVVTKNPLDGRRKAGSIGLPLPRVEVSIQDESGVELASNEIGEVCVRGGNVMQGYWRQPEETSKVMRNGWLLTGDIGYRDSDGYYYITDRKKDMLLVNGINVYPREIEEVLYQFPGVKEAAVIGKPDLRKGEQPVAFVAPSDGITLEEKTLQHFVRERLADYKIPRKVVILAALPRNATGKILKTALRDLPIT